MANKKHFLGLVLAIVAFGLSLAFGAAVLAGGDYATCPYDGEQAPRTDTEQISSSSCPAIPGTLYNAEKDTYAHDHINGALLEHHTFSTVSCLQ